MIYDLCAEHGGTVVRRTCFTEREYNEWMSRVLAMGGAWWFTIRARPEQPRAISPERPTTRGPRAGGPK